jgi:hypothetical protein
LATAEEQQHEAVCPSGIFQQVERPKSFVIVRTTMPPRDPDEDEDEDDEENDTADEPPVVREPDDD